MGPKRATQLRATNMVTLPSMQSASPVQPPKTKPVAGAAVRVTTCGDTNKAPQVGPHWIPTGLLVTVPSPVLLTVNVYRDGGFARSTFTVNTLLATKSVRPSPLKSPNTTE